MKIRPVLRTVGFVLLFTAVLMLLSVAVAFGYGDGDGIGILLASAVTAAGGGVLILTNRGQRELDIREGFAVVSFGWLMMSVAGALPYLFTGTIPSIPSAFFESASGFTTTGASVLTDIESMPHGVLFWRSFTHWVGGMGIIVFSIAILPFLGVGGLQMFKAESPGPTADKLTPRIRGTAEILWVVYVVFTVAQAGLLMLGGMNWFDSVCHAFGTLATGGFSTKNASIAHYDSAYLQWVIVLFMYVAGISFGLHWHALRGNVRKYWESVEFRFFSTIMLAATLILAVFRWVSGAGFERGLREAAFQTLSIGTTTGYASADFELWPVFTQVLLVVLMFMGGMAGSTGGGLKAVRIWVLLQQARAELHRLIHPNTVHVIRLGRKALRQEVVQSVLGLFLLYALMLGMGTLFMAALGLDPVTAFTSVVASLSNIGPGLGDVGPTDNYAFVPAAGKWVLAFLMIVGRLEFFTVLVLLTKTYWEKI